MPFATICVQADALSTTLDATGVATPVYGERWVDLESVQYARIQYMASADTVGSSMTIAVLAYIYDSQGVIFASNYVAPDGPSVGQSAAICIGPWNVVNPALNAAGDVKLFVKCTGTANAAVTVNWVEIQFR